MVDPYSTMDGGAQFVSLPCSSRPGVFMRYMATTKYGDFTHAAQSTKQQAFEKMAWFFYSHRCVRTLVYLMKGGISRL